MRIESIALRVRAALHSPPTVVLRDVARPSNARLRDAGYWDKCETCVMPVGRVSIVEVDL